MKASRIDDGTLVPAAQHEPWAARRDLAHGFFGRAGGVSRGAWSSLNLSAAVGDEPASVDANWARVRAWLDGLAVARMRQVHGDRVVRVVGGDVGDADGLMTDAPGVALAVITADCVPILMTAPARRVAMALHAGWRGTVAGIAARGVEAASDAFGVTADEWEVVLGPSIGRCCYEVGSEIVGALESRWGAMPSARREADGRHWLDLRMANRLIFTKLGVPNQRIADVGPCTACARAAYFSHRAEAGHTGRQLSVLGWREA